MKTFRLILTIIILTITNHYQAKASDWETFGEKKTVQEENTRKKVYVDNIEQFFDNLDNHTELVLTMDTLDLSAENIKPYLKITNDYTTSYRTEKLLHDEALILSGFENLVLNSIKKTNIMVKNPTQTVLTFYKSKQIQLHNVRLFHTADFCEGEVLVFENSEDIEIKNSALNGSGSIGLYLKSTNYVLVENTEIFNNSQHAILLENAQDVTINQSQIFENNCWRELIQMVDSNCRITNTSFSNNETERFYLGEVRTKGNDLYYSNCNFYDNRFEYGFNDVELNYQNNTSIPSFYSEEGMVYSYFQAENTRNLDEILSYYSEDYISYYYNLFIGSHMKNQLIAEYEKSWKLLSYSKNDVQEVIIDYNSSPVALNTFSFIKYNEPNTIYRIKNKVLIRFRETEEEGLHPIEELSNYDAYYNGIKKIESVELLEKENMESVDVYFKEVKGIEDEKLEQILKSYREIMHTTLLHGYFNGASLKETMERLNENSAYDRELILHYSSSPHTSENDRQKLIDCISSWTNKLMEISRLLFID